MLIGLVNFAITCIIQQGAIKSTHVNHRLIAMVVLQLTSTCLRITHHRSYAKIMWWPIIHNHKRNLLPILDFGINGYMELRTKLLLKRKSFLHHWPLMHFPRKKAVMRGFDIFIVVRLERSCWTNKPYAGCKRPPDSHVTSLQGTDDWDRGDATFTVSFDERKVI